MNLKQIIGFYSIFFITFLAGMKQNLPILHEAVKYNNLDQIKKLIGQGADINEKWEGTYTPLMTAALNNQSEVLNLLLQTPGIDVNAQDSLGMTALMWAVFQMQPKAVKLLLNDARVNVHLVNEHGKNALLIAAYKGYNEHSPEIIRQLLMHQQKLTKISPSELAAEKSKNYFHLLPSDVNQVITKYTSPYSISDEEAQKVLNDPKVTDGTREIIKKILEQRVYKKIQ